MSNPLTVGGLCQRGHLLKSPTDIYTLPGSGARTCCLCMRLSNRRWKANNRERAREIERAYYARSLQHQKARKLKSRYNISLEDQTRVFQLQGGLCAICEKPLWKEMQTDHDHTTGRFRGLLCKLCNSSLGHFGDNIQGLMRAVEYLKNPPAQREEGNKAS